MRQAWVLPLLLLVSTLKADTLPLDQMEIEAMTPIDGLPSSTALDAVFGVAQTVTSLQDIALSTDPTVDFGVQLRAIRTLPAYCPTTAPCSTTAHDTLVQLVAAYDLVALPTARDLLRLRATIEALGLAGVPDDVGILTGFLDHTNRDVRATTAKALGTLCNTVAIQALRTRSAAELSLQVKLAISAALRDLANCPGGT
jgi:hypothetical protein